MKVPPTYVSCGTIIIFSLETTTHKKNKTPKNRIIHNKEPEHRGARGAERAERAMRASRSNASPAPRGASGAGGR